MIMMMMMMMQKDADDDASSATQWSFIMMMMRASSDASYATRELHAHACLYTVLGALLFYYLYKHTHHQNEDMDHKGHSLPNAAAAPKVFVRTRDSSLSLSMFDTTA